MKDKIFEVQLKELIKFKKHIDTLKEKERNNPSLGLVVAINENKFNTSCANIGIDPLYFDTVVNEVIQPQQTLQTNNNSQCAGLKIDELLNLNICNFIEHLHKGDLTEFDMTKWIDHNCTNDNQLSLLYGEIDCCTGGLDKYETRSLEYAIFLIEQKRPKLFDIQPQQPLHFTRAFTADEQKKLFEYLKKPSVKQSETAQFLPNDTSYNHFCYVFGGTPIPNNEKPLPLQWLQSKQLLRELLTNKKIKKEKIGIAEIERQTPKHFVDEHNNPFKLAKNKQANSLFHDSLINFLATL
jgi:hypothetical protein